MMALYESQETHAEKAAEENIYEEFSIGYPITTYQQPCQDVFPDHHFVYHQQQMQRIQPNWCQPMMADGLQAVDNLWTNSPASNAREKSPFRYNLPYDVSVQQQTSFQLQKQRTSTSPKELILKEDDWDGQKQTPLFQEHSQQMYQSKGQSNLSDFYIPAFNTEPSTQLAQQNPFVSQTLDAPSEPVKYPCTFHGCRLNFDTSIKLFKHKREGHRHVSAGKGTSSASTSPKSTLRNSQAGSHRCNRISPSTGRPCNSIFSRTYDLTRHDDTIHSAHRQKVSCDFCTDGKRFSRSDALTRHMRVVHPDIDWIGNPKRISFE